MWSDWLVFYDYDFSVSALWCSLATPTVLLGFLLPWMWGILHVCSSKAQLLLLTLDKVAPPDLECGVAPLGPPAPAQPLLLGHGFGSFIHWPQAWGSSSRLPPLTSDTLAKEYSKFSKLGFNSMWTVNFQMFKLDLEKAENWRLNCQHPLDHRKSKRVPKEHLLLLYWLCQSLWLCGSQQTVENPSRYGNTRPPDLPLEKSVCRSGSNS